MRSAGPTRCATSMRGWWRSCGPFCILYPNTDMYRSKPPIVLDVLHAAGARRGIKMRSRGDLPASTGLVSCSSLTVGLLHSLYSMQGKVGSSERLAREACSIEIDRLKEPIGKQDQCIPAYGGLQFIQFNPDGTVFVDPVIISPEARSEFSRRLLMFFTGETRDAREVLLKQNAATPDLRPVLHRMCEIAHEMREVLTSGRDLDVFGELLHEAWEAKRSLTDSVSNPRIDELYERGLRAGALGGKLLGSGGGGFLLFFCEAHNQGRLREELAELRELRFSLDPQGSKIVHVASV